MKDADNDVKNLYGLVFIFSYFHIFSLFEAKTNISILKHMVPNNIILEKKSLTIPEFDQIRLMEPFTGFLFFRQREFTLQFRPISFIARDRAWQMFRYL